MAEGITIDVRDEHPEKVSYPLPKDKSPEGSIADVRAVQPLNVK